MKEVARCTVVFALTPFILIGFVLVLFQAGYMVASNLYADLADWL